MALKLSEKTGVNEVTLTITIDGKSFENAIVNVYNKNKKKYSVPGFRKGKAPRSYIEKFYGNVFTEDALDEIFPSVYSGALEESGVEAVSAPFDFDLVSMDNKEGVEFTVKVTTKPEIELTQYKGLEAEKREANPVRDEDVEHHLSHMQEDNARILDIDSRPAENGDIANIDFEGFTDGKAFEGGKAEGYDLTIGSGNFIPGFEEQIIGHNIGEEFDIQVKFPEDYAEEMAGKDATFHIKLHSLKRKELPELDDDFAKDVSEFDTMDELRADIKAKMTEQENKSVDDDFENEILKVLSEKVEGEIPDCMAENLVDEQIDSLRYRLQQQHLTLDQYLQMMGADMEMLRSQFRETCQKRVKANLALEKVAKLENIEVTEEDIAKEYETIAEANHMEVDHVKTYLSEEDLKNEILRKKAIKLIMETAVALAPKAEETKAEDTVEAKDEAEAKNEAEADESDEQ